jgi:hypothetical protein
MNPVIGKCPVCGQGLTVTQLDCSHCGTEIGGKFALGPLYRLDPDDLKFIEIFVKNRGSAYKVGEELGMAYSAVRARLTEIIRALGYESAAEVKEESTLTSEQRQSVLDDLAQGKISAADAVRMLQEA